MERLECLCLRPCQRHHVNYVLTKNIKAKVLLEYVCWNFNKIERQKSLKLKVKYLERYNLADNLIWIFWTFLSFNAQFNFPVIWIWKTGINTKSLEISWQIPSCHIGFRNIFAKLFLYQDLLEPLSMFLKQVCLI